MDIQYRDLVSRNTFYKVIPGPAPWDNEPDLIVGIYRGFAYAIIRSALTGNLNGYLAIPQEHPWYTLDYQDIAADIESDEGSWSVHGGLTYAMSTLHCGKKRTITVPGKSVWWIGFDTAHAFDFVPSTRLIGHCGPNEYRNVGYVFAQLLNLTRKASEHGQGPDIQPEVHLV